MFIKDKKANVFQKHHNYSGANKINIAGRSNTELTHKKIRKLIKLPNSCT